MKNVKNEKTILQLMEILSEESDDSLLGKEFWEDNREHAKELARRLSVTPMQAVLLSICLRRGPRDVDFNDIAHHLDISNIRALTYSDDINALVHAKYLKYRNAKNEDSFDVPRSVIRAFKNNEVPEKPRRTGLSASELFSCLEDLFGELDSGAILPDDLYEDLSDLFSQNSELGFVRGLKSLGIMSHTHLLLLVILCHLLVNRDDDEIIAGQIEDIYCYKSLFHLDWTAFRDGSHPLMQRGLVEHVCDDGIADTSKIHLTNKAKTLLLVDFHLHGSEAATAELIKPDSLAAKKLFYTDNNARQVTELSSFLMPDRYKEIHARMEAQGFRTGFSCLFYGGPGIGKTETVYQIARQTGRCIMAVNVASIKDKWVGNSEKNIKDVFERYRLAVSRMELAPILLFNEADGLFGIRQEGAQQAVDKMENSIQNIILEEMESLDGILIATTNLTQNLDPAFERRFLYKICFEQPDASVREKIWHSMLPDLPAGDCAALASEYELSGGQMENVTRKFNIHVLLYGDGKEAMSILRPFCNEERLNHHPVRKIGF